eukprot:scaffold16733_cov112-Isochrysis_galbana.AAC.9
MGGCCNVAGCAGFNISRDDVGACSIDCLLMGPASPANSPGHHLEHRRQDRPSFASSRMRAHPPPAERPRPN